MSQGDGLDRALAALDTASKELEAMKGEAPAYSLDALRFVRAEVGIVARRVENLRRVLVSTGAPT